MHKFGAQVRCELEQHLKEEKEDGKRREVRNLNTKLAQEITGEKARPNKFSTTAAILAARGASQARQRKGGEGEMGEESGSGAGAVPMPRRGARSGGESWGAGGGLRFC